MTENGITIVALAFDHYAGTLAADSVNAEVEVRGVRGTLTRVEHSQFGGTMECRLTITGDGWTTVVKCAVDEHVVVWDRRPAIDPHQHKWEVRGTHGPITDGAP